MIRKKHIVIALLFTMSLHPFHNISAEILKKYLPENPIILEAGAYEGVETIEFTKVWPNATIHAFEPVQNLFAKLITKLKPYRNVSIYNLALSDKNGSVPFYISHADHRNDPGCDQSSSILKPKLHLKYSTNVLFREPVLVQSITLDTWAKKEGIDHIDFIWFDLQGVEYDVLKASPKILKTVRAIFTEVNYLELYENNTLYEDYKKWLAEQGFTEVWHKKCTGAFGDALFVRNEILVEVHNAQASDSATTHLQ